MIFFSQSEDETRKWARVLAKSLRGGEILALQGGLGAGKTVFVKGLCRGLGIRTRVKSPTFTLFNIYTKKPSPRSRSITTFCHLDAYRLGGGSPCLPAGREFLACGVEDFFNQPYAVTAIEWADKVKSILRNKKVIWIKFRYGGTRSERIIDIPSFFL